MEDAFGTGKAPVGVFGGGPLSLSLYSGTSNGGVVCDAED